MLFIGLAVDACSDASHGSVEGVGIGDVFATHVEEIRRTCVEHTPSFFVSTG